MALQRSVHLVWYCCLTRREYVIVQHFNLALGPRIVHLQAIIRWTLGQQELVQEAVLRAMASRHLHSKIYHDVELSMTVSYLSDRR